MVFGLSYLELYNLPKIQKKWGPLNLELFGLFFGFYFCNLKLKILSESNV